MAAPTGDAQADQAAWRAAVLAESILEILRLLEQMARSGDQILALIGQAELAGRAMEQPDAEMLLQLRDLTRHG